MAAHGSGALFASLFFDQINSPGDQEGFLLGKIIDQVHDRISDSQISNFKVETRVCIYSYLPWPRVQKLYNQSGQFSIDLLKQFLAGKEKDVIGWYKFRRNSTLRPSLKESALHCNLICSLSLEYDQPENFMFFLCTTFTSKNLSTHSYDHCFLKHHHGKFHRIPVQILNLGDTTHATYRQQPNLVINPGSGTLHSVLHTFRNDFVTEDGEMSEVRRIRAVSESVNKKLQTLSTVVLQSELKLGSLEAEVQMLAKTLEDKQEECRPAKPVRQNSPPPPYMEIFKSVPTPSKPKIHSMRSESKFRRSIGDSDGSVRQVRQISMDEEEYCPREDKSHSPVNIKDYDIIEGPEKICQALQNTNIVDQSISFPPDVITLTDSAVEHTSNLTAGVISHRRSAKTNVLDADVTVTSRYHNANPGEAVTRNADHFSFVNNMLEKEKHSVKSVDCMAVPIGENMKLPSSYDTKSDETGSKSRTRSGVKSTGKHKLYAPSYMIEDISGPELNTNNAVHVSKERPQMPDVGCKGEKTKSEISGNGRMRTRHSHGLSERLRPKDNFNNDCRNAHMKIGEDNLRTRSSSPRKRQSLETKTSADSCVDRDCSKDAKQGDGCNISSSPVF